MRRRYWPVVVVAALVPLSACSTGGGDPDAYIVSVRGTASVQGAHPTTFHGGRHQLAVGDTLTVTSGSAMLTLPHKASLELRAGRNDSVVKVAAIPTVIDGDALAVASSSGLRVHSGAAVVHLVDGAARLRRSSGVTVAVYEGAVTIDALGQELATPALRQAAVSDTGALPVHAVPLVYDRSHPDPWDVRYLGDAIDLGSQLERRSRALTAEIAAPTSDAALLTKVVPPLRTARGFSASLVDTSRSVGETVVGASIALGGTGDFVKRWTGVFDFRQEGADWGLVALDQQARRSSVFGVLDSVLNGVTTTLTPVTSSTPRSSTTTSTTSPKHGTTTTTSTTQPSPTPTIPAITIPQLPSPQSPPTTPTTVLPQLPDPLQRLVGPLLGKLNRPTQAGSPAVASDKWPKTSSARKKSRGSSSPQASVASTSTKSVRSSHK